MKVAFLAVGDELLTGRLSDQHLPRVGRDLAARGYFLVRSGLVPDREEDIVQALDEAAAAGHEVLLVTGGLGPTPDDVTRQAIGRWAGVPLDRDMGAAEDIRKRLRARGREATAVDLLQAMVPRGAECLSNPVGTACGFRLALSGRPELWVLPGVPGEFRRMWQELVLPRLAGPGGGAGALAVLRTSGAGEREIADMLAELGSRTGVRLGTYAGEGEVEVHLALRDPGGPEVSQHLSQLVLEATDCLGDLLHGHGEDTLADAVARRLLARGENLATAESVTGGLLASLLTDVPGSSRWFLGGAVAYSVAHKVDQLGLSAELVAREGHVSPVVSLEMARRTRILHQATWGLASTGWAGPSAGKPGEVPGRVHLAWVGPGNVTRTWTLDFPGSDRSVVKLRAAKAALRGLWLALGEQG
ncbi:MAG: nicotinamide-nucleotide amidohydrolase family protein [Candidatus Sericytochromatia bacterium]|nr:nicotinamide-nucleotide amidohydrolase family protein [Candidatus Sericytochromatia bacterium]